MARKYVRDKNGRFASKGGGGKKASGGTSTAAKNKAAKAAMAAKGQTAVGGVLTRKVAGKFSGTAATKARNAKSITSGGGTGSNVRLAKAGGRIKKKGEGNKLTMTELRNRASRGDRTAMAVLHATRKGAPLKPARGDDKNQGWDTGTRKYNVTRRVSAAVLSGKKVSASSLSYVKAQQARKVAEESKWGKGNAARRRMRRK